MADTRALPSMLLLVIALLLAAILFRGENPSSSPSRAASVSTGRLEQVTARLAAAVEKLDLALARTPSGPAGAPQPASTVVALPTTPSGTVEPLPPADKVAPKDPRRLQELRQKEPEPKAVLREYAFRTYADILGEFGFPDDIWLTGDAVRFNYEFPGPDGYDANMTFAFVHGIVMGVYY